LADIIESALEKPEWVNPIEGIITSLFGNRRNPVTNMAEFHNGIDVAAPIGTPVLAVRCGVVEFTGRNSLNGNYMILRCDMGYEIIYAHLNQILVRAGHEVSQGQKIAYSGNTGQSTGPHLHFGLRKNGNFIDPLYYVNLAFSDQARRDYANRNR
jgi:murein DD-endopeptidase MepM/ murein hydrolase activator NlpD